MNKNAHKLTKMRINRRRIMSVDIANTSLIPSLTNIFR